MAIRILKKAAKAGKAALEKARKEIRYRKYKPRTITQDARPYEERKRRQFERLEKKRAEYKFLTEERKKPSETKKPTSMKGGLMGGAKAGKGKPTKQMSKKKKKGRIKTPITMRGLKSQIENKKRLKRLKKSI